MVESKKELAALQEIDSELSSEKIAAIGAITPTPVVDKIQIEAKTRLKAMGDGVVDKAGVLGILFPHFDDPRYKKGRGLYEWQQQVLASGDPNVFKDILKIIPTAEECRDSKTLSP